MIQATSSSGFTPHHLNATPADFVGNGAWGRYVFLPGSDGRARSMAQRWQQVREHPHPRAHNLFCGTLLSRHGPIDVASVATGMGAPSVDIIFNELWQLGARNFIRVGTAGSLQPSYLRAGSIVVATAAVRDDGASQCYLPAEVPAVASLEFLQAAWAARPNVPAGHPLYFGLCHSKDSLYAREFGAGPLRDENERYMQTLRDGGVLASEMEASMLFTLGSVFSQQARLAGGQLALTGAVLAVIGDDTAFGDKDMEARTIDAAISFAFDVVADVHRERMRH